MHDLEAMLSGHRQPALSNLLVVRSIQYHATPTAQPPVCWRVPAPPAMARTARSFAAARAGRSSVKTTASPCALPSRDSDHRYAMNTPSSAPNAAATGRRKAASNGLGERLTVWWPGMAPRERQAVLIAGWIVGLALLWWVALGPALNTLRKAPAQHAAVDAQLAQMLRMAATRRTGACPKQHATSQPRCRSSRLDQATAPLGATGPGSSPGRPCHPDPARRVARGPGPVAQPGARQCRLTAGRSPDAAARQSRRLGRPDHRRRSRPGIRQLMATRWSTSRMAWLAPCWA